MNTKKAITHTILFAALILITAALGLPTKYGYLHAADPLILLASLVLPTPYALAAAGLGSLFADVFKGYAALAPATLVIKLLMVLAVKALLSLPKAKAHPECWASPAALVPVAGYYCTEVLGRLASGAGAAAFSGAAETLKKDLLQAAAGVVLLIVLYDLYQGVRAGRAVARSAPAIDETPEKEETP